MSRKFLITSIFSFELKIENGQLTMDVVAEKYGQPTETFTQVNTESNSIRHAYDYEDIEVLFYFFSEDVNDIEGKIVPYINVY